MLKATPPSPRGGSSGWRYGHSITLAWKSAGGVSLAFLQPLRQDAAAITGFSCLICGPAPSDMYFHPLSHGPAPSHLWFCLNVTPFAPGPLIKTAWRLHSPNDHDDPGDPDDPNRRHSTSAKSKKHTFHLRNSSQLELC